MSNFRAIAIAILALVVGILIAYFSKWGCDPAPGTIQADGQEDPPITMARFINTTKRRIKIKPKKTVVSTIKVTSTNTDFVWGQTQNIVVNAPYEVKAYGDANSTRDLTLLPPVDSSSNAVSGRTYKLKVEVEFLPETGLSTPAMLTLEVDVDPDKKEEFRSGCYVVVSEVTGVQNGGNPGTDYVANLIAPYAIGQQSKEILAKFDTEKTFLQD